MRAADESLVRVFYCTKDFMNKVDENLRDSGGNKSGQKGFTLIEVTIAMIIFLVALLGVFVTFTYAVNYNNGNSSRAQALAILQREVELYRSAKFTPNTTDSYTPVLPTPDDGRRDLTGGVKQTRLVTAANGNRFIVAVIIDDDPFTPNAPSSPQVDATKTLKEVSITVTLDNPTPGWQTSIPATVVLRRVRAN